MRIVVAMSGGVDSSVAAALLAEQGHEVIGLSMQLYDQRHGQTFGRCCSLDDLHDARRVAGSLGFPHYVLNLEQQFQESVISNFLREYASGRTPIPCTHCNSDLKFSTLVDRAAGFGAEHVATGHYARVERGDDGRWRLLRGRDTGKDQSYFLFALTQDQLARAVFPVGGLTKDEVRAQARRLALGTAEKPDSQELCFIPEGDHAAFIEARDPTTVRDGAIRTGDGAIVGRHHGIHRYTVGQRKGLGLATGAPVYVLRLEPETNTVVVGTRRDLERTELSAGAVHWMIDPPPERWMPVSAQIRHRHRAASARVRALPDARAEVIFDEPQSAITPGQAVVYYDGDRVVGGGWID